MKIMRCRACGQPEAWCEVYTSCPLTKGGEHKLYEGREAMKSQARANLLFVLSVFLVAAVIGLTIGTVIRNEMQREVATPQTVEQHRSPGGGTGE